jgi:4-amino-4-deoxychorismate lyase
MARPVSSRNAQLHDEASPSLEIFTTVRYAPELHSCVENQALWVSASSLYMLRYHIDRLTAAAIHLEQYNTLTLLQHDEKVIEIIGRLEDELSNVIQAFNCNALRVRLVTDQWKGIVLSSTSPTQEVPVEVLFPTSLDAPKSPESPLYDVYLCPHSSTPSIYTRYKTSERSVYTAARVTCGLPAQPTVDPVEVLLWNSSGELMEGSLTSIYVKRGGHWMTPAINCGGNEGTTRRWALERDLCSEGIFKVNELKEGEVIRLSNGLRGFLWGVVWRRYYDKATTASVATSV